MKPLKVLDLFSGIGGFSLGLERMGSFETVAFCEIDPKARKVLAHHWPKIRIYDDVQHISRSKLQSVGIVPRVICGGFPCQDISLANAAWGERLGLGGARSGLWSEFARIIDEFRPLYAIVENVSALLGLGMGDVLGDLARIGYDAEWHRVPASAFGAPHERDRLWIIAYPIGSRRERLVESLDPGPIGPWGLRGPEDLQSIADSPFVSGDRWPQPLLRRVDDGLPARMDRLHGVGNAIVPQIAEAIGRAILAAMVDGTDRMSAKGQAPPAIPLPSYASMVPE